MKIYLRKPDVWVVWPQAPKSETEVFLIKRRWLSGDVPWFMRPLDWLILLCLSEVVAKAELDVQFHEVSDES